MSFMRSFTRLVRLSEQVSRAAANVSRRGYADAASAMSFTFATPSECFYQDANVKQVGWHWHEKKLQLKIGFGSKIY